MTFENILVKSQKELKRTLKKELQELRYSPISSKGFLYAKGTVPVLLVAHLDTVHRAVSYTHLTLPTTSRG